MVDWLTYLEMSAVFNYYRKWWFLVEINKKHKQNTRQVLWGELESQAIGLISYKRKNKITDALYLNLRIKISDPLKRQIVSMLESYDEGA